MTKDRIMKRFVCPKCGTATSVVVTHSTEIFPCASPKCPAYAVTVEPENPHA